MPSPEAEHSKESPEDEVQTDLTFASLDDLWDELSKRLEHAVLLYDIKDKTTESTMRGTYYSGGLSSCLGLIEMGKRFYHKMADDDADSWHRRNFPDYYPVDDDDETDPA